MNIVDKLMKQQAWAKKTHPQMTVGKAAHGLVEKPLGMLTAYVHNGKAEWSSVYDPRQMTEQDQARYKALKAKMRALAKQMEKLKAGAYERGYPIYIASVVEITNTREGF